MFLSPLLAASTGSRITAIAAARPTGVLSSAELGRPFGRSDAWVEERTGIQQLGRVEHHAEMIELAIRAATSALERAGLDAAQVDLLLVATCSLNVHGRPALSALMQARLGGSMAHMDINVACAGFCYALSTADSLIRAGAARRVLVVAAEGMSDLIDPDDLGTSIIFGDGAGAAVVEATNDGTAGIGPTVAGSDGRGAALIRANGGGSLEMAGREVFRWAVETVPGLVREACRRAGVDLAEVDLFVPHQANLRIIDAVAKRLAFSDRTVIATDIARSGNTSAASIPMALHALYEREAVRPGALAVLVGFGAGLAYAAQTITMP